MPMTAEQMEESIEAARRKSTLISSRANTVEINSQIVSNIVQIAGAGLENISDPSKKIRLDDTGTVMDVSKEYIRLCAKHSMLPTMNGVAAALGHTRQSLWDFSKRHPKHPTAEWIDNLKESFAEIVMQNALAGSVSAIPAIFYLKSRFDWIEAKTPDIPYSDSDEIMLNAEEVAEKYSDLP